MTSIYGFKNLFTFANQGKIKSKNSKRIAVPFISLDCAHVTLINHLCYKVDFVRKNKSTIQLFPQICGF